MQVKVRKPDGRVKIIDLPATMYLEIGDVLSDGSVVLDLEYPDDIDEDMLAMDLY